MLIKSTRNLHYPITVTALHCSQDETVERFTPLFSYVYKTKVTESDEWGEPKEVEKELPAKFESETEGVVTRWCIRVGNIIQSPG